MTETDAAAEFLQQWSSGPWALTAIQPDRKKIETKTFKEVPAAREWIEKHNGKLNIYFHVNPAFRELTKKAEREDISALAWLHVDIDPRAGESLETERERAKSLLTDKLPKSIPPPTVIVFSGGGYQGFWKLQPPLLLDGTLEKAEEAKRYNQQLELLFGADNCHNIDRIMRLPGTVNIPDERKKKKGRVRATAKVEGFWPDRVYKLSDFTPAPVVQLRGDKNFFNASIKISGNIERLTSVDQLNDWGVSDRTKIAIVQGRDPETPKVGDNSRSAWIFDVCCQLCRCKVPDELIFSIITDPEFGISESVLDKGANAERYALRQIERAKEEIIDPWLRRLNEQFAVVGNLGGKCRVIEEVMDHSLNRPRLTRQSFEDFRNRWMNQTVQAGTNAQGEPAFVPVGKWWLLHRMRRQYDTIMFSPGREVPGTYNLWKGFACAATPGDCSLFLAHIKDNVCCGSDVLYRYILGWMARCVQKPDTPGQVALVLRGKKGVGKSIFAKIFGRLFGRHFLHISNPSHLIGTFNAHLRDTVLLFADEAFYAGDKRHASILKTLITEDTITIEAKGVDAETSPNYVHLIMAGNENHLIPAGGDERRFLVVDVGQSHRMDSAYFRTLLESMNNGGYEALLHYLLEYDLKGYDVRHVPQTDALYDQKLLSLGPEEDWWLQKLLEGRIIQEDENWREEIPKEMLLADYVAYTDRFKVPRRGNATTMGKFLSVVVPGLRSYQKMGEVERYDGNGHIFKKKTRVYHYNLGTLESARQTWEELYGKSNTWPTDNDVIQSNGHFDEEVF